MNTPNKLTILRVILVPLMIGFYVYDMNIEATIVFIIASITDTLDGQIARKKKLITNFGKIMDPLADKILVISALVLLVEDNLVQSWMLIVILAREFIVSGLRTVAAADGLVIAAGISGKLKTITQMLAVPQLMLDNFPGRYIGTPLDYITLWICIILTVISGLEYIYKNRQVFLKDGM